MVGTLPTGLLDLAAVQALYSGDTGYVGVVEYPFNTNGSLFIVTFNTGANAKLASGDNTFTNRNISGTDCIFIARHLEHS